MANTIISLDKASVGDAIAINSSSTGTDKSHFIAVIADTVTSSPPSGYTWYGVVYGRERNGLMVAYHTHTSKSWATTGSGDVSIPFSSTTHPNIINTTVGGGLNTMLNHTKNTYVTMSLAEVINRVNVSSNTSTLLHPSSPYTGEPTKCPMNKANFDNDTNGAKSMYGTYERYVSQTLPFLKGSKAGVFAKRCGRINTKELQTSAGGYSFPAAQHCYTLAVASESANHWWLPDMYELYMMMRDEAFSVCSGTCSRMGKGAWSRASTRWSCVRSNSAGAWSYDDYGFSIAGYFYYGALVCPVTLLEI